jgi:hypothetical protein
MCESLKFVKERCKSSFQGMYLELRLRGDAVRRQDTEVTGDVALWRRNEGGKGAREATRRDTFILIIATVTALQMPVVAFFLFAIGTYPAFFAVLLNEKRLSSQERARAAAQAS